MNPKFESDPVTQTVAELRQLTEQILGPQDDTDLSDENPAVLWTDLSTGLAYSLRRDFMGDPLISEAVHDDGKTQQSIGRDLAA